PATVTVTGNRGYSNSWTIDSRGQAISGSQDVGYSQNQTFTIRVSDSGRGSGQRSATSPQTVNPPPPIPVLTVSKGPQHAVAGCGSAACTYIRTTTKDFGGNVSCSANSSIGAGG